MHCCSSQDTGGLDYNSRLPLDTVGSSKMQVAQTNVAFGGTVGFARPQRTTDSLGRGLPQARGTTTGAAASSEAAWLPALQKGISRYLDSLFVFGHASCGLAEAFEGALRDAPAMAETARRVAHSQRGATDAAEAAALEVKAQLGQALTELAGGGLWKDGRSELRSLNGPHDLQVLGRCFHSMIQLHQGFLKQALAATAAISQPCNQALEKSTPPSRGPPSLTGTPFPTMASPRVAPACNSAPRPSESPLSEMEAAVRSWQATAEATSRLRGRGADGGQAGRAVRQLLCTHGASIPESHLKELNARVDAALQWYQQALDSLGHVEYAMKAGFHLHPRAITTALQGCCAEAEAEQAGHRERRPNPPLLAELPSVSFAAGPRLLRAVAHRQPPADNLHAKMTAVRELISGAAGGVGRPCLPREEALVAEVLGQLCPATWHGACKTAVQLLFGQAGLVVVHSAQLEDREAYSPQISVELDQIMVQVPSTWCLKEDPATMSLLQRRLDPERALAVVDVLYTATFDLHRWRDGREQHLPSIQIQLRRNGEGAARLPVPGESESGCAKAPGSLQRTFSKLTSRLGRRALACGGGGLKPEDDGDGAERRPGRFTSHCGSCMSGDGRRAAPPLRHAISNDNIRTSNGQVGRAGGTLAAERGLRPTASFSALPSTSGEVDRVRRQTDRFPVSGSQHLLGGGRSTTGAETKLPSDREMQDVIDFLSGFNTPKGHATSPRPHQRHHNEQQQQQLSPSCHELSEKAQVLTGLAQGSHATGPRWAQATGGLWMGTQRPEVSREEMGPKSVNGGSDITLTDSIGTSSTASLTGTSGSLPRGTRNNTWPHRLTTGNPLPPSSDMLPFDPAVGADPEYARYIAGVRHAMQQKRQGGFPWDSSAQTSWLGHENTLDRDVRGWPNTLDSASSSDETSSTADSLFSMFWGPDLLAAVGQRSAGPTGNGGCERRGSVPPPSHGLSSTDNVTQDSKTHTWPPKSPWQQPNADGNSSSNHNLIPHQVGGGLGQWNDSLPVMPLSVWSTAGGGETMSTLGFGTNITRLTGTQSAEPCPPPSFLHTY
uniref:granule associated Rac and RHOG effector protein 1 isoform X2 n=1 Tax=Myxine glutinosa TaxID=7769 RepID=UPI00358E1A5B